MAKAYLKINTSAGKEESVRDDLLKLEGVTSADLTAGEQDIISLLEGASYEEILKLIVGKVRKIDGIERTVTNLVLE